MTQKESIINGLNEQQKLAVINYEGPTLIVAGAGSGKTKTLTQRIAYMIASGVKPEEILALTFTKKAAGEMRSRIIDSIGTECHPWRITMGTFHSIFIKFLKEFHDKIGFPEQFTIYDENDSETLIKQIFKKLEIDGYKVGIIRNRISLAKNNLLTPQQYELNSELIAEDRSNRIPKFIDIFREYCIAAKVNGAMDFDDILLHTHSLLRDNPEIRQILGQRYKYILVDEYQDTNIAQYKILRYLTEAHQNICVVGDDSQSIYSFRGAKIENILRFAQDYPKTKVFRLEQNYRSTNNIVQAANSLIENNKNKLEKHLFTKTESGEQIHILSCSTDKNEAATVAREIKKRLLEDDMAKPSDFAILYRNNYLSRVIEDELRSRSIPYIIYGGHSFYKRKEIMDTIAYMKFFLNTKDDVSLMRIINFPARGIGDTSIEKIKAKANGENLWDVINNYTPEELGIRGAAVNGLKKFKNTVNEIREDTSITSAKEYVNAILDKTHLVSFFKESGKLEEEERAENIDSLRAAIEEWEAEIQNSPDRSEILDLPAAEQLQEWLADVALLTDSDTQETNQEHVTLMTIHASKGLEFKYIFMIGVEEGLFPSDRVQDLNELEEERRVFYVAMTRAKKVLYMSWSEERFKYGEYTNSTMSRFIHEIDRQYVSGLAPTNKKRMPWEINNSSETNSWRTSRPLYNNQATSNYKTTSRFTNVSKNIIKEEDIDEIEESNGIKRGTRVFHRLFGNGTVLKLERRKTDVIITISFDSAGQKKLKERFANLKII